MGKSKSATDLFCILCVSRPSIYVRELIRFYQPLSLQPRNPWEGVNLLPFIDVQLLKDTIATYCPPSKLNADERRRNSFGKVFCYRYDASCTDTVDSPNKKIGIPDIIQSNSSVSIMDKQHSTGVPFKPELFPGTQIPYPGFPALNVLPFASVELTKIGLNCFGSPSKYPTMVLTLHQMPEIPSLEVLAENIIGKSLFINWPMMHEGRVVAISDEHKEIRIVKGKPKSTPHNDAAMDRWHATSEEMNQMYHIGCGVPGQGGVDIGPITVRLKLLPLQGMKTNPANGAKKKLFGQEEAEVPLQLALWQAPAPDPRFVERGPMTLSERFPENSSVVLTKGKYRGCVGTVVGVVDQKNVGVKVQTLPPELPFGMAIARSVQESYISSIDAARILKMHPGLFGKITGRLQFEQGKYDLGLNLKSADGSCVVGYTRKKIEGPAKGKPNVWTAGDSLLVIGSARTGMEDDSNEDKIKWEYTPKAIRLVETYRRKFPQLFSEIKKAPNERRYDANKIFGPNGEAWLPVIREWLNNTESAKLPRSPVTSDSMSYEAVAAVQRAADVRKLALGKKGWPKESLVKVPGSALYREGTTGATDVLLASDLNSNEAPMLGDRVVNLCADGIPFGLRGTVVGIHEAMTSGAVEVVMDEEFIGGTSLQGACSNFRGKLCLWAHLLKIVPENSENLVGKLVPKGSGKASVDKIISNIERQVKTDKEQQPIQSSWDTSAEGKANAIVATPDDNGATSPKRSTSRPRSTDRTGSTGRGGRQGAWREARGPDEKGYGFKGERKGKSGLSRWKVMIKSKTQPNATKQTAELKSLLGVGGDSTDKNVQQILQRPSADGTPATTGGGAEADLKAMLGVGGWTSQPPPPLPPQHVQQQQPPKPPTAADALLQMMAQKQQPAAPHPQSFPPPGGRSSFNFTYVPEGKEQPPPQHPTPMHHHIPPPMYPPVAMIPMPPYGPPPPHRYGPPFPPPPPPPHQHPYHHPGFAPPMGHPVHQPPAPQRNAPPAPPNGPSVEEFPPLGATTAANKKTREPKQQEAVAVVVAPLPPPMQETAVPAVAAPLVPSVVAGKARPNL